MYLNDSGCVESKHILELSRGPARVGAGCSPKPLVALPVVLTPLPHTPGTCPLGSLVAGDYELNQKFQSGHGVGERPGVTVLCKSIVPSPCLTLWHLELTLGKARSRADLDPRVLPQAKPQALAPEKRPSPLTPGRQECGHRRHQGGNVGALALPGATGTCPPAHWLGPGVCWRPNAPSRSKSTHQEARVS